MCVLDAFKSAMNYVRMKIVGGMTWKAAFVGAVLPFIPLDIVKCIAATLLAKPIRSAFFALEGNAGEKVNVSKPV